jgi:microcystin-dependent protein
MITIGEIRQFAYTPNPMIWAPCDGSRAEPSSKALYAVIGNTYGGDSAQNFSLPDFNSQAMAMGLPLYYIAIIGEYVNENKLTTPLYRKKLIADAKF